MGRYSAKRALTVVLQLEGEIADIARYGGEPGPALTDRGSGNVGWNDPTGNAALKSGAYRTWLDEWDTLQRRLSELADAALRLAPAHEWPMCSICGTRVIGEARSTHHSCQMRRDRRRKGYDN
jgi:hypothetical protein